MITSALYRGHIRHRRFTPVSHEFRYAITMIMFDLDQADNLFRPFPLLGTRLPALGWFRRRDYHGPPASSLKQHILGQVRQKLGLDLDGKVLLLTHARYWGLAMNPIAVFYCYDGRSRLSALVLQVTSTPWREKVLYVLRPEPDRRHHEFRFDKEMHVSPFNPMDMTYTCRIQDPDENLSVHIENHVGDECHTDATLALKRIDLTRGRLLRQVLGHPATTLKVMAGIYWNAFRLWRKRAPFYSHPQRDQDYSTLVATTDSRYK